MATDPGDFLARLIADALTGKPVKLGLTDTPKVLAAIGALRDDPAARVRVFSVALRGCMADPVLRMQVMRDLAEMSQQRRAAER